MLNVVKCSVVMLSEVAHLLSLKQITSDHS